MTGTRSVRRWSSSVARPMPSGSSRSRASPSRVASETVISRRSPPTWLLSSSEVPCAMIRPWSMTTILSARRSASSRYWVVSSSVVPPETRVWMTSHISVRPRGSSPVVGSSRNSTGGSATSAPARSSRRRIPPEYVRAGRSAASPRLKLASSSRARSRLALRPRWYSRPIMSRFSKPVRYSSTAAYCPERPILLRTPAGLRSTSTPTTSAEPSSGCSRVERIRTTVVLPAPFGPSRPSTVPVGTEMSTPSSAVTLPYRLTSPRALTASLMSETLGRRSHKARGLSENPRVELSTPRAAACLAEAPTQRDPAAVGHQVDEAGPVIEGDRPGVRGRDGEVDAG